MDKQQLQRRPYLPACPFVALLFGLAALSVMPILGQPIIAPSSEPGPDWVTVDGPHIDYQSYLVNYAMLDSPDTAMQERALDHLESAIRNGHTSQGDQNLLNLIARASLDPSTNIGAPGTEQSPDRPVVRVKGIRLLTMLGGKAARELLCRIALVEPDPAVLSETYYGMRQIRAEPNQELLHNMIRHLGDPYANGPNDGLVQEILRYVLDIHSATSNLADRGLFDAILAIYQDRRYLQKTNELALKTLKLLMGME